MIRVLFFLGLTMIFASCEGGTIYIDVYDIYGNTELYSVYPHEKRDIYLDDQQGSFVGDNYSCTQEFDSLKIEVSNKKILVKSMMNQDNWDKEETGGRKSKVKCIFVVTNEDLE